jgi:hypothetical protein
MNKIILFLVFSPINGLTFFYRICSNNGCRNFVNKLQQTQRSTIYNAEVVEVIMVFSWSISLEHQTLSAIQKKNGTYILSFIL